MHRPHGTDGADGNGCDRGNYDRQGRRDGILSHPPDEGIFEPGSLIKGQHPQSRYVHRVKSSWYISDYKELSGQSAVVQAVCHNLVGSAASIEEETGGLMCPNCESWSASRST
jgi:hypothetical protein